MDVIMTKSDAHKGLIFAHCHYFELEDTYGSYQHNWK